MGLLIGFSRVLYYYYSKQPLSGIAYWIHFMSCIIIIRYYYYYMFFVSHFDLQENEGNTQYCLFASKKYLEFLGLEPLTF